MAFDPERVLTHAFPEVRHRYAERDAILYALGIGLGANPLNRDDLAFLYEPNLRVLPTMAVTLASPGMWVREPSLGIDWVRLLHAGQSAWFPRPLAPKGDVVSRARVASLDDRGEGKGAILVVERNIHDAASDELLCRVEQTIMLRGNGGFSKTAAKRAEQEPMPERAPDHEASFAISPRAALIYRLSGDYNPLHIDPDIAAKAGFERPILHGLASYGVAGWMVLRELAQGSPERLASLSVRFAGVVYPGDNVTFSMWRDGSRVRFLARVGDRKVLDQGVAELRDAPC
jgi:acyl dehydratase